MKNILSVLIIAVLASCQSSLNKVDRDPAQDGAAQLDTDKVSKKEIKKYLKNISVAERNSILQKARVTAADFDLGKVPSVDLIADLQATCGSQFQYNKALARFKYEDDASTFGRSRKKQTSETFETYVWPKVECTYRPDESLGGGTSKFQCDFNEGDAGNLKTHKVKYIVPGNEPNSGEILETVMAPMLSRLIGFHAEAYCPADVTCKNCSSKDPWKQKGAAAAGSKNYSFPISIVEFPMKGMTVSNKDIHPYVQGIEWYELRQAKGDSAEQTRQLLIEREAWMLWLNFIQHADAGSYNERLSCLEVKAGADGKPMCTDAVMYTHDYGHAFYKADFEAWASRAPFQKNRDGEACRGNMTMRDLGLNERSHFSGLILGPTISSEARDLLVQRLEAVTDSQWLAAFKLARIQEFLGVSANDFLSAVKKKINQLRTTSCLPFDSHTSVLATQ